MTGPLDEARRLAASERLAPVPEYHRAALAILLAIHDNLTAASVAVPSSATTDAATEPSRAPDPTTSRGRRRRE